ncbi:MULTISPECIES: helix-turn-helix domain-containing protein [Mycolicibacterium]|uniref:helix-turn-helix domain-containing protein n=1 Tax=Mycolicibacterium TaxID=1866885 RepID=UPI000945A80B|nr:MULTISPECIES: helix-turn-helix domain-containing protein [Mycolicibacterium]
MSELPELLTPKQLSEFIGISEASLGQDRYLGQGIPYVKVGKRVRYLKDDVLAYLQANRVEAGNHA